MPESEILLEDAIEFGLDASHEKFCRAHDWGEKAELKNGEISFEAFEYSMKAGKSVSVGIVKFTDFQLLLDWAGY